MPERRLNAEPMLGDYNPFVGGDALAVDGDYHDKEPAMHWTDGFPHDFHGWGPLAPDYGREDADEDDRVEREPGERFRARLTFDDEYLTWRARQFEQQETERGQKGKAH
jgi:hypothetical protein